MARSSGGRPGRRRVVVHFTNRKNAPLLFSTRLGTPPNQVWLQTVCEFDDLAEFRHPVKGRTDMQIGEDGNT